MLLARKHHFCIWCGVALWGEFASEEHIIPQCIGGRLRSPDVCRICNNTFGAQSDHKLLRDEKIYRAAIDAGMRNDELLRRYYATTTTDRGRKVKLQVRDGVSMPIGGLGENEPYIGADTAGRFSEIEIRNLRGKLKAKCRTKHPHLPVSVVDDEVNRLVDEALEKRATVSSDLLGEGLAWTQTSRVATMTMDYHPLDTQRAIAKSLFTIAKNVIPHLLDRPTRGCVDEVSKFARATNDEQSVVHEDRLPGPASLTHSLTVTTMGSTLRLEATLFGVLHWWVESQVLRNGSPAHLPNFIWASCDDPANSEIVVRTSFNA